MASLIALALALLLLPTGRTVEALGPTEAPWTAPLQRVDDALAARNPSAAVRALQQAHSAALGSRRWDGMVLVGDAARRVGQAVGAERTYDARARQAYLVALFRARNERSLEGVLLVGEAFSALGDVEVVKQCVSLARSMIAGGSADEVADLRLRILEQRLAERSFASGPLRVEPF